MVAQVPLVPPVSAAEQAMHVLVHAALQQKPFAQLPLPHVVPVLHVAPLEPPSTAASMPPSDASAPVSGPTSDAESDDESAVDPSPGESAAESPPASLTSAVNVSAAMLVSCWVTSLPLDESSVVPSRPPSSGILLRSKSTSSSQPGIAATPMVAAAITRPHLIDRFVVIGVLVVKAMARLRTGP